MRIRRRTWVLGAVFAGLLTAAGLSWRAVPAPDIPLATVLSGPFTRAVTGEGTLRAVHATPVLVPLDFSEGTFKISWLASDGSRVRRGDVVTRFDATELRNRLQEGIGERSAVGYKRDKSRAESSAARENLRRDAEMAARDLEAARSFQKKDAELFSRSQIIESEIDKELASRRRDQSERVREVGEIRSRAGEELLAIERRQADQKVGQARRGLASLQVMAPHEGVLILERDWRGEPSRVGDTVWAGELIASIPDPREMEAEVFVLEADAGGLAPGKAARVYVESDPDRSHPARIERVDTVAKPRARNTPVQYFGVTLRLARTDPAVMKPGARARATITVENRARALSVPLQAVFQRDGRRVVYRWRNGVFDAVPVGVGPASLGRIVIETGLNAGDRVALKDPIRPLEQRPERPATPAEAASSPARP